MKFFASEKIGSKRQTTPEGYLLIEGTPIARTGIQKYAPEELGNKILPGADGMVDITRSEAEVFSTVSLASFNGKPFTNDHPSDLIDPTTWRNLSLGVVMNPRRGEGEYSDHVVADILVCDRFAIELIEAGKVELSNGYNAEYFETGVGTGEQRNIIGNHVALVSEGRCGPTCAIGDHSKCNSPSPQETFMKKTYRQKLMDMFGTTDKAALDKMLDESPEGGGLHIHLPGGADSEGADPMEAFGKRMDAMEAGMKTLTDYCAAKMAEDKARDEKAARDSEEEKKKKEAEDAARAAGTDAETEKELEDEAPEGEAKEAKEAKDSRYLSDSFQASVALGEILVPGFSPPVFDKAAAPKLSLKTICDFRKKILDAAYASTDGKVIVNDLLGGKALDTSKLTCAQTRALFFGAAAAKKQMNNAGGRSTGDAHLAGATPGKAIRSVADLQRRANDLYKPKAPASH